MLENFPEADVQKTSEKMLAWHRQFKALAIKAQEEGEPETRNTS